MVEGSGRGFGPSIANSRLRTPARLNEASTAHQDSRSVYDVFKRPGIQKTAVGLKVPT